MPTYFNLSILHKPCAESRERVDTSSMALRLRLTTAAFLVAFALASLDLSVCHVVKGQVSCLDCKQGHDLSGIRVMVKCDKVKKTSVATTEDDGSLEAELPSGAADHPLNCLAKVLGGPDQLYASRNHMVAEVVTAKGRDGAASYTLAAPLAVSATCPLSSAGCGAYNMVGSSETVDIPLPREWGFAPSSYYIPFFPIIGIP